MGLLLIGCDKISTLTRCGQTASCSLLRLLDSFDDSRSPRFWFFPSASPACNTRNSETWHSGKLSVCLKQRSLKGSPDS